MSRKNSQDLAKWTWMVVICCKQGNGCNKSGLDPRILDLEVLLLSYGASPAHSMGPFLWFSGAFQAIFVN